MDAATISQIVSSIVTPQAVTAPDGPAVVVPAGWKRLEERPLSAINGIQVSTLQGIADYLDHNVDQLNTKEIMVHVYGATQVRVLSKVGDEGVRFRRHLLIAATTAQAAFPYGQWTQQDDFLVRLQGAFVADQARDSLLRLASQISVNSEARSADDGIAQEVNIKKGVTLAQRATIQNPFILSPFRTFREVQQPSSPFIFRVQEGTSGRPAMSLHITQDTEWMVEANASIAAWLREKLGDEIAVIG